MEYHLHTKNFNLTDGAKAKIAQKIEKFNRLLIVYPTDACHGDLVIEKETEKELYHAHLVVTVDKKDFFSKKDGYSYEEAVDRAVDGVREQLTKFKAKQRRENTYKKRREQKETSGS